MESSKTPPIEAVWRDGTRYEVTFQDPGEGDELDMIVTVFDPQNDERKATMGAVVSRHEAREYLETSKNAEIVEILDILLVHDD